MAGQRVPIFSYQPPVEDLPRRKDFVQGVTAGGILRGLAYAAILGRVLDGRGSRRRSR